MKESDIRIRAAVPDDAPAILAVYAPYVEKTAITFEYAVPSPEEMRARVEKTLRKYPYLVAEENGEVLGYAYLGPFVGRAAYDWAAEVSIYLREDMRGRGLGRRLYCLLEKIAAAQHILNLYACIGYPRQEDAHLTRNSVLFHEHLGYKLAGTFRDCGYKFGAWYDMVWMEKTLGDHPAHPAPVIPFPELDPGILAEPGL